MSVSDGIEDGVVASPCDGDDTGAGDGVDKDDGAISGDGDLDCCKDHSDGDGVPKRAYTLDEGVIRLSWRDGACIDGASTDGVLDLTDVPSELEDGEICLSGGVIT